MTGAEATGPRGRLIFALDVPDLTSGQRWAELLHAEVGLFKVGLQLFTAVGPDAVHAVTERGIGCFLDLKLHDIPATMSHAVRSAADLGVDMLTVHTTAGPDALKACAEAARGTAVQLLGVTVLTSMDDAALAAVGSRDAVAEAVKRRTELAVEAGLDGFVCSGWEAATIRALAPEATIVVPGIRPEAVNDDQKRTAAPRSAIDAGATHLVVGRPIRNAPDPVAAARAIVQAIADARGERA